MNIIELQALGQMLKYLDHLPWPLPMRNQEILITLANRTAVEHGYRDWIDAYYRIKPMAAPGATELT